MSARSRPARFALAGALVLAAMAPAWAESDDHSTAVSAASEKPAADERDAVSGDRGTDRDPARDGPRDEATAPTTTPAASRPPRPSDPALLDRVIRDGNVTTNDPAPFAEYAAHVRNALLSALGTSLDRLGVVGPALTLVPVVVLIAVAAIIVLLLYSLWRSRQRPWTPALSSPAIPLDDETALDLRAEAERLLAQGALHEALAALWRWLAGELAARGKGRTGPEVTRSEFVRSVRQTSPEWDRLPELATLARTADVLAYGPGRVTDARVRALVPAVENLLR